MDGTTHIRMILDILYRRKWIILVPVALSLAAGWAALQRLPKIYKATTTILVTPSRLPQNWLQSTVTTGVEDSLRSITVQITSRKYLAKIVKEFNLAEDLNGPDRMEKACARLKKSMSIDKGRNAAWFEISVENRDPVLAASIANSLADLYIEHYSIKRQDQARTTLEDVDRWLEERALLLKQKEEAIAEFKQAHPLEFPTDLQANIQLQNAASQKLERVNTEIEVLEQKLATLREQAKRPNMITTILEGEAKPDPVLLEYQKMKAELSDLALRYTDLNPVIRRKKQELKNFESRHPEVLDPAGIKDVTGGEEGGKQDPSAKIAQMIHSTEQRIDKLRREAVQAQSSIDLCSRRIENMHIREAELVELSRDLQAIRTDYADLAAQKQQAIRSVEVEEWRKGGQFEIQDRARVPTAPFKPQPLVLMFLFLLGGVVLGGGSAALLEFMDQTIRNELQYEETFPDIPLLVSIPNLVQAARQDSGGRQHRAAGGGS